MGQAYPELRARRGADHRDAEARGDALPQDARARAGDPRRGDRVAQAAATCSRARPRSSSTTPTASRSTSPRTRCARAASASTLEAFDAAMERQQRRRRAPSWAGSGEAATEARLVRAAREGSAPPSSSATRPRRAEGVVAALVRDGKEVADAQGRRDRRGRRQPDAVLRRVRRPGRRHRRDERRRRALRASPTRRRRPATCSCIIGTVEQGTLKRRRRRRARRRSRAPHRDPRATTRRRISCTRRCARCSATTSRRRARWSRPTACASTSRIPSR